MGLLSFLSRKETRPATEEGTVLFAQPYNLTVPSLPPIQGTVPVAGNGPNVLEALRKTPWNKTPRAAAQERGGLKPPEGREGRPQTAPSRDKARLDSLKSNATSATGQKAPPVPNSKVLKPGPPYRLPEKLPEVVVLGKPAPPFARQRSESIRSTASASTRGFVDLLDAQSILSPRNFHERVKAAGARNYGEDVADRNVGENGIDLDSAQARAFYASASGSSNTGIGMSRTMTGLEEDARIRSLKRHSLGAPLRAKSFTSDYLGGSQSKRSSMNIPELPQLPLSFQRAYEGHVEKTATFTSKADRRKSLPSYATMSSSRRSVRDEEFIDDFPEALNAKIRELIRAAAAEEPGLLQRTAASPQTSRSKGKRRDTVSSTNHDGIDRDNASTKQNRRHKSGKSRRYDSNALDIPKSVTAKSSLSSIASPSMYGNQSGENYRMTATHSPKAESLAESHNLLPGEFRLRAFQPLQAKTRHIRTDSRDGSTAGQHSHTRSMVSSSGKSSRRAELDETIPERTSSIRHWSIDSTTSPATSSYSSNPFRPQSRHTTNTSVDLTPFPTGLNISYDSSGSPPIAASLSSSAKPSRKLKLEKSFNIDDYISSDDDFDKPHSPRVEAEEHLLFKDTGYGFGGSELPGLPGLFDTAPPLQPAPVLSPPRSPAKSRKGNRLSVSSHRFDDVSFSGFSTTANSPWVEPRPHKRSQSRQAADYDDDSDSVTSSSSFEGPVVDRLPVPVPQNDYSDDELSFDIPMVRRTAPAPFRQTSHHRLAKYASREEVIEEEHEHEKVDLNHAIQMWKEAKRRKRLSGATIRARSEKGKEREEPLRLPSDMAGFEAYEEGY